MQFLLILAVFAASCGGDDGINPHEVGACDAPWVSNPHQCEAACAGGRAAYGPGPCSRYSSGMCDHYVAVDGVDGCCEMTGSVATGLVFRWEACE